MADKINIKDKIDQGAIYARLIYEVFGKPKENVDKALSLVVEQLRSIDAVKVIVEKNFEPKLKDDMWTNFVELEVLVKNLESFFDLVVDYLPASVEIIEPETNHIKSTYIAGVLNDLSVKLININVEYQKAMVENQLYKKKLNTLISMSILKSIQHEPKTLKDLSEDIRITEEDLELFLKDLTKTGRLELKEEKYHLK